MVDQRLLLNYFFVQTIMRRIYRHHFLCWKINDMANTLIKNVLCQEDTLDPDGFNRNQVKVLPCSLIAVQQRLRIKVVLGATQIFE